jgi:hypothetical protein
LDIFLENQKPAVKSCFSTLQKSKNLLLDKKKTIEKRTFSSGTFHPPPFSSIPPTSFKKKKKTK